jgi:tetratricopeptide (TPR) repeat protein
MKKKQAKAAQKTASAAKSRKQAKEASSKPGKTSKGPSRAASSKTIKPAKTAKPTRPAKLVKPAKSEKSEKSAQAKSKSKPGKIGAKPANAKAKPAGPKAKAEAGLESVLSLARAAAAAIPAFADEAIAEPVARDERASFEKVMASLTQIFGGRDTLSDAELDALLDDKMASGEIPPSAALDPLDEAQSLVYEAWNSEGSRKASLARRALELSEDCADAYLILAQEESKTREAALELYRKAYEAGRRALDPAIFTEAEGDFWAIMETRPYMRARLALAECLWDLSRKEEALGHLRELMRLNPSDNQGVRYILLQCLLESGADEELGDLLSRYGDDPSPEIAYSRALWQFRRHGRDKAADAALAEALRANPHVPAYLLKRMPLPSRAPSSAAPGGPEAAGAYAAGALEAWHQTLGAVEWLASRT